MKVCDLKNFELLDKCPVCASYFEFKRYVNGGQCKSRAHGGKDFFFMIEKGTNLIYKLEVIDGLSSIEFDLKKSKLKLTLPDKDDIILPLFNMDLNNVSLIRVKELMIFT